MRRDEIRAMVKSYGLVPCVETFRDLLEGNQLDNGLVMKLAPEKVSLRELWEGFVGDAEETIPKFMGQTILSEEVNSTGFVATSRLLINSMVMAAYNALPKIGMSLCTNMPSNTRHETIAGFTEVEKLLDVAEGEDYKDSGLSEKYVTSEAGKKGRLIYITEEAIMEDRTGQLQLRCKRIGQEAALDKEKTIINGVVDKFGTVYRPSGTPTTLYSTAHGNLMGDAGAITGFTTPAPLVDWTDIDEAGQFHDASITDDRQIAEKEPIFWNPTQLLVTNAKKATALRIRNATEINEKTNSGDTRTTFSNPVAGQFDVLSSVYLAAAQASSGDWYYGNFPEQFFWHDVWPIQTFAMGADAEMRFKRDVVSGYKVRYLGGIFATDFRHVIKVKAS